MNESRRTLAVGLFVFIGLVVIGGLLLQFSKGGALFTPTYELRMLSSGAPGLVQNASVQIAGVRVGHVDRIELGAGGRSVIVHLRIERRYPIQRGAVFRLDQAGFLGDQYVTIVPAAGDGPFLEPGDQVHAEAAFSFQEIARSAGGLIQNVDMTVSNVNQAFARIDETILSQHVLTNLATAVVNFRSLSERSLAAMDTVDRIIRTNAPSIGASVSNLVAFSHDLRDVSGELHALIVTNREEITASLARVRSATERVDAMLADVEAGKGLAGGLLRNEDIVQNIFQVSSNLAVASSNLNHRGLWRFLWPPKSK